ncbi:MAG: TldD/PmbA family protein [Microthrixaceae bacterium]
MDANEALALVDAVVERARPAEQLEAVFEWSDSTEVRAHDSEVEHFVSAVEHGVGIRVIDGGRTGMSWTAALDDEAIDVAVAEARDNARFASADPNAGLADPDGVEPAALATVDAGFWDVSADDKLAFALDLDARLSAADDRMVGHEGADYSDAFVLSAIASTTGVRCAESETIAQAAIWALASDGEEVTTGFGLDGGRGLHGLDAGAIIDEAVGRATDLLGASKPPSEKVTVVFDPYVTSQFLAIVAGMLSGSEVARGRTPFADRVGDQIAAPSFGLGDDPHAAAAPTSGTRDGEGLATRQVSLIEGGVLRGFLHNSYTARELGSTSTASAARGGYRGAPGVGPRVLTPVVGTRSRSELLVEVGDAVAVQELSGLHSGVNPTSGDLSVGMEGVRLRGGEPAEPIKEVTIASTIQRMLTGVVSIGSDLRRFPWDSSGVSLAIEDVTLSGA